MRQPRNPLQGSPCKLKKSSSEDSSPKLKKINNAPKRVQETFKMCADKALEGEMRAKHCACLERNGKIIEIECNEHGGGNMGLSTHAENNIRKKLSRGMHKLKKRSNYTLYVVRYSVSMGYMNSKPCSDCVKIIRKMMPYVSKVVYTHDSEHYITEERDELSSKHVSAGYLHLRRQRRMNC